MKRSYLAALALGALSLVLWGGNATAADAKTVSGKSSCATCDGVTKAGHNVMIVAEDGTRWVLVASDKDSASYKAAHKERKSGKAMTATLAGEPVEKKDDNGKAYKEVKVSDIKIG